MGFQIVGKAFDEAPILAAGHAYQQQTDWHLEAATAPGVATGERVDAESPFIYSAAIASRTFIAAQ